MKAKRILAGFLAAGMLAGYTLVPDAGKAFDVVASAAGNVTINATNFPDEKFREYVKANFDNGDGVLTQAECDAAVNISVSGTSHSAKYGISSLKGIEFFTKLKSIDCSWNNLTTLDVTKNTLLVSIHATDNELTELDVSKNPKLIQIGVQQNSLNSLDVSHNPLLEYLDVGFNRNLTSLDTTNNPLLTYLHFQGNKITTVDLSNNTKLIYLICDYTMTELDVSKNTALERLVCDGNMAKSITSLNLENNTALKELSISGQKQLSSLDFKKNTALKSIICYDTKIAYLDLSQNTALEHLDCYRNRIANLDLTKNTLITSLDCSRNVYPIGEVETFDLSNIYGFDPSKASDWNGADFDAETNTLSNFTGDTVTYTYDMGNGHSETFRLSLTEPDPPIYDPLHPDPNAGDPGLPAGSLLVWANGKDVKDDPKTTDVDETALYKTASYLNAGCFSGGKWCVAVTPEDINTAEKFTALFDEKGKLTSDGKTQTGNTKKLASAKIKDGVVTVTAGKEEGVVQVWIYELKNKKIVVDEKLNIAPVNKTVYIRMAAGAPVFANADDLSYGVLIKGKKAVSKLTLLYKNGADEQDGVTLAFGDKKAAFHSSATFTTEIKEGTSAAADVSLGKGEVTLTPTKAGKASVSLKNVQSGKAAKLNVTVVNAYKVTVPEGASVRYKSGKDYVTVNDGDYAPTKAKLEITASGKTVKVNGSAVKGGKFTVGATEVVITLE